MTQRHKDILFILTGIAIVGVFGLLVAFLLGGCLSDQKVHDIAIDAAKTAATTAVDRVADRLGVDMASAQTPNEALIVGIGSLLTTATIIVHRYKFHKRGKT